MLYVESFQPWTVMLKERCGEGLYLCWLGGWMLDCQPMSVRRAFLFCVFG